MPARRLHRIVQEFKEAGIQARGFGFLDYFANSLALDLDTRRRLAADPAIAKAISYADPTGELATSNAMKNPIPRKVSPRVQANEERVRTPARRDPRR